ncbi:MAG: hypothetical protein OEU09_08410 [Rhodospirillales bacterium]|nr:hypothetical protein [Rhodospirillales bacterium]MDH3911305.1 hypothetical protein [Rhodospirillales bacterium]
MELLFRSVARAGGIEVPPEVQIFAPPKRSPWERRLAAKLARTLPALLSALWNRLAAHAETAPAPELASGK